MDKYLLTLMVTFEQEYAIQRLFGRHGWEYNKITDEIPIKSTDQPKNPPSEVTKPSMRSLETSQITVNNANASALLKDNSNKTSVKEATENDDINRLESSISSGDAHQFEHGDEFDGDTDTEQTLNDLGIVVKEEVYSDDGGISDDIGKNSSKTKNSGIGKRVAHNKFKTVSPKRRREATNTVTREMVNTSGCEVKIEKLSSVDKEKDDAMAILETLPSIEHVSKIVSADSNDIDTFMNGLADLDDSGYSATQGVFFCRDCSYTFPLEKYYKLHKRDGQCVFSCQFCNEKYTFKNFSKYEEHLKQHRMEIMSEARREEEIPPIQKKLFSCDVCPFQTKHRGALYRHKKKHSMDRIECKQCTKTFCTNFDLKDHVRDGKDVYVCTQCGKGFRYKRNLTTHERSHAGALPFSCCGKGFASKRDLEGHIVKDMEEASGYDDAVDLTDKPLNESSNMLEGSSLAVSTGETAEVSVSCGICEKKFKNSHYLKRHQQVHEETTFRCGKCHRSFVLENELNEHLKNHKIWLCVHCGKTLTSKFNLDRHALIHNIGSSSKMQKCTYENCDKMFLTRSEYESHVNTHLPKGGKPFKCEHCGRTFSRNSNKNYHERTCSGKVSLLCTVCGKRFKRRSYLENHTRAQHEEQRYLCACGKKYAYSSSLIMHQMKCNYR